MSTTIPNQKQSYATPATGVDEPAIRYVIVDSNARKRLIAAAAAAAVLGLALLAAPFVATVDPSASILLKMAGITVLALSILFFYLSPARHLRSDVCDAMCQPGVEFMSEIVGPYLSGNSCVYVPAGPGSKLHVSIALPSSASAAGEDKAAPATGEIHVNPPGLGLLEHAKLLGGTFTDENLKDEIRDVVVNGLELAGQVEVERYGDGLLVELKNPANLELCEALRKNGGGMCDKIGCPVCSFVTCAVVEGTGKKVSIDSASSGKKTIRLMLKYV